MSKYLPESINSCSNGSRFANQKTYANFWAHYDAAFTWMNFHRQAVKAALAETAQKLGKEAVAQESKPRATHPGKAIKGDPDKRTVDNAQNDSSAEASLSYEEKCDDIDDTHDGDHNIEMDDEMMAFFKETIEHRKERDAKRLQEKESKAVGSPWAVDDPDDYILAEDIGVHGISRPSVITPNTAAAYEMKKKEMLDCYGKDAEKIAAMETSLDMRFEQYYDKYKPQLWPVIPLKLDHFCS